MKKRYMTPSMEITKISPVQILAGSPLVQNANGDVTSGELQDEGATGPGLSRGGRGFWDEEDY